MQINKKTIGYGLLGTACFASAAVNSYVYQNCLMKNTLIKKETVRKTPVKNSVINNSATEINFFEKSIDNIFYADGVALKSYFDGQQRLADSLKLKKANLVLKSAGKLIK